MKHFIELVLIILIAPQIKGWSWYSNNNTTTQKESLTTIKTNLSTDGPTIESTTPNSELDSFSTSPTNSANISSTDYIKSTTMVPRISPDFKEKQIEVSEQDINGCAVDSFPELKKMFNNESLSDLKLVTEKSKIIFVHTFVLNLKSPVFADIISKLYSSELSINDEEYDIYYNLIKFLYTEKFPIDSRTDFKLIENVYRLAQKYKVNRLLRLIEHNLNKTLNLQNFKQVYDFLSKSNMTDSVTHWRQFVRQNSDEIFQKNLYLTEDSHIMEVILYSMDMNGTQKIMAIEGLVRQKRSDVNITRYRGLITIEECYTEQLSTLKKLGLLNIGENDIFEQLKSKLNKLCQIDNHIKILNKHIETMTLQSQTLQRNNQELKEQCRIQAIPRSINNHSPNYVPNSNVPFIGYQSSVTGRNDEN